MEYCSSPSELFLCSCIYEMSGIPKKLAFYCFHVLILFFLLILLSQLTSLLFLELRELRVYWT